MTVPAASLASSQQPGEYLAALAIAGACTAVAYPLYPHWGPVNTVMLYLLGTTLGALRLGRGPCVVLPVANILAFDFFSSRPRSASTSKMRSTFLRSWSCSLWR
jgi:K+-sensing histidine kinase KdpD